MTALENLQNEYTYEEGYDWERYQTTLLPKYLQLEPIITNQHVTEMGEIYNEVVDHNLGVNDFLNYLDPRARAHVGHRSYVTTFGFFLDQSAMSIGVSLGIERGMLQEKFVEIDEARLGLLGVLNQPHPYIWTAQRDIKIQNKISPEDEQTNMVDRYLAAIDDLNQLFMAQLDKDEMLEFLRHRIATMQHGIDQGQEELPPKRIEMMQTKLVLLENAYISFSSEP